MRRETTKVVREAREASVNAAQRATAAEMQGERSQELASSLLRLYNEIADIHEEIPLSPTVETAVDKGKGVEKRPNPIPQPLRVEEEDIFQREDEAPAENPPLEAQEEVRTSQVREWTEGIIPPRAESPEELTQAVNRSWATVIDQMSPDLEKVSDELIAFLRPRLMSNTDSVNTILSTHTSLQNEAEYWGNMSHKCYVRHRRAHELGAITTEKVVQELWSNNAPAEALEQGVLTARFNLNRATRTKEAGLAPSVPSAP
jgi:hypothetical protein